jgi:tetratricopeptide (TPR) repeat protein
LPLKAPLRHLLGLADHDPSDSGRLLGDWVKARNPGLAPLIPLLAPVLDAAVKPTPESTALAPEFLRDRVANLVLATLDTACTTPLLLIAEDAHWFDETTGDICARLVRAAGEREWLLCVTRRPGDGGFIPNEPDLTLTLAPLDEESARGLVDSATDAAPLRPHERDRVVSRAGGNPLFLEELVRIVRDTDIEALPDSLDAIAMREIDSLPSASRHVLLLASVLGRSFERNLLWRLSEPEASGSPSEPFVGLEPQFVSDGPNRLRFRHALLQEAAYQTLPFRTRLAMHRKIAEAVEEAAATPIEVAPLLSQHFLAAQEWERAWKYARLAAEAAMADHAPPEAAIHLERAVEAARHLPGTADKHDLAEVLAGLGATRELLGEYEAADNSYRRSILTGCLDPSHLAQLIDRRAYIRGEHQGKLTAAIRQLRTAAAQISKSDIAPEEATWIRATLSAREADVRKRQGRFAEAIRCSRQGVELAEKSENTRALALSLSTLDQCLLLTGRYAEAVHFPSAIRLYESVGDHAKAAVTLNNFAVAAFYNSEWDTAATRLQQAINESTKAGDIANAAFGEFNLGDLRLNQGWWDEAFALLSSARRTLEACDDRFMAAMATLSLGRVSVFLGETDVGLGLIESAATTLEEIGTSMECLESRARLTEALIFVGDTERARDALRHTRALEKISEDRTLSSLVDRLEISLHMAAGEIEVATAKYSSFLEKARESGSDYEVLMLITLDRHLSGGGPDDGSVQLLERLGVQRLPIPVWL